MRSAKRRMLYQRALSVMSHPGDRDDLTFVRITTALASLYYVSPARVSDETTDSDVAQSLAVPLNCEEKCPVLPIHASDRDTDWLRLGSGPQVKRNRARQHGHFPRRLSIEGTGCGRPHAERLRARSDLIRRWHSQRDDSRLHPAGVGRN